MSTRTVRLDDNAEATLAALQKQTGLSVSSVLKRGLETFALATREKTATRPYEAYCRLDLGPGGDAADAAADAKARVADKVRKKYGR